MGIVIKAVVELGRTSGIAADAINNDFYFYNPTSSVIPSTLADDLRTVLVNTYNNVHSPSTVDIASLLSTVLSRTTNKCSIKFYEHALPDTWPWLWGSPFATRSWTLDPAGAGNNLPSETALVLTYHADLTDVPETETNPSPPPAFIRPASRRRGRLYFGPFTTGALSQASPNFEPFPNTNLVGALCDGAKYLADNAPAGWEWHVFSGADSDLYLVDGGFVDNAFDSQRRRGNAASSRTNWSA